MKEKFAFSQEVKEDFYFPICKDILYKPLETFCEHYFCGECFKQALGTSGFPLDCPVCRTELNSVEHIKRPSRLVLRLIAELKVKCNDCGFESSYEDHSTHIHLCETAPVIVTHPTAGPSTATLPDPPAQNTMTLERAMVC